jgi:hypothetical protein
MPWRIQSALRCMSRGNSACCMSPSASRNLAGGLALGGHQVAYGVLHVLLELLQVLDLAVFLAGKLLGLLAGEPLLCGP